MPQILMGIVVDFIEKKCYAIKTSYADIKAEVRRISQSTFL